MIFLLTQAFIKMWPKDLLNQNHLRCLAIVKIMDPTLDY